MTEWKDFFTQHREYIVKTRFYDCENEFTLEELYQAFKARLLSEMQQRESLRIAIQDSPPVASGKASGG